MRMFVLFIAALFLWLNTTAQNGTFSIHKLESIDSCDFKLIPKGNEIYDILLGSHYTHYFSNSSNCLNSYLADNEKENGDYYFLSNEDTVIIASWHNKKPIGNLLKYSPNQQLITSTWYRNGYPVNSDSYLENGFLYHTMQVSLDSAFAKTWHPSGQLLELRIITTKKNTITTWYPNGQIKFQGAYRYLKSNDDWVNWEAFKVGEWRYYNEEGKLTHIQKF